jgi:tetratricopeptide (TPR) repeat protein
MRAGAHLAAAALAAALAAPAAAQPVTVDAGGLMALARAAEAAGALDQAAAYAAALLARDPGDFAARLLAARVARDAGQNAAARSHARGAWAAAATPPERFAAAMVRAQALASDGNRTAAMFWLRRAADEAPTAQTRAIAARDFAYVRARNPLSAELAFSAAPSSNVNNGSRYETITLFGAPFTLSPAARALSGGVMAAGLRLGFRLTESEVQRTDLRLTATHRAVWISDPAGAGVDPGDFAFTAVEASVEHRRRPGAGPVQWTLGATAGRNWYGGAPLSDYLRLEAGWDRPVAGGRHVILGAGAEKQWRLDTAARNAEVLSVRAGVVQALASGDRLRLDGTLRATVSAAPEVSNGAAALRFQWDRGAPVMGLRVGASAGIEGRDYGPSPLAPGGRQDLRLDAALSLTVERLGYLGFAPVIDLKAVRSGSNVPLYDGTDIGISLGFRSVF